MLKSFELRCPLLIGHNLRVLVMSTLFRQEHMIHTSSSSLSSMYSSTLQYIVVQYSSAELQYIDGSRQSLIHSCTVFRPAQGGVGVVSETQHRRYFIWHKNHTAEV